MPRFLPPLLLCLAVWTPAVAAEAGNAVTTTKSPPTASALATFDDLCRAIQDNYPMLEFVGWQDAWVAEYRAKVTAAPSTTAAFEAMNELVCRLNDYHTRFSWPGKPSQASPALRLVPVWDGRSPAHAGIWGQWRPPLELPPFDGLAFAVADAEAGTGARPGDVVVSVDGIPLSQALAHAWRHSPSPSVAGKLRSAAGNLLRGPPGRVVRLEVRRLVSGVETTLPLDIVRRDSRTVPIIAFFRSGSVPIIRITRWRNDATTDLVREFDTLLEGLRTEPALVMDVRGNGGGDDELAARIIGRFISARVIASISFRRQVPATTYERMVKYAEPRGPWRFAGKVAVLTDEGCMSATEHFVSGMAEAGALLCGTPTSGACGLIRPVELAGGARLNVSRTFPIHTGGFPSPMSGIVPHLWQPPTLTELRSQRDGPLEAAIAFMRSGDPLPPRLQPRAQFSGAGTR